MKELVLDVSKWDGDMNFQQWRQMRDLYGVIIKGGGSDVGRYVVRPDYEGQAATPQSAVVTPDYDAELDIDGSAGHLTVHKLQEALGTYADGVISGQVAECYQYRRNVYSIEHDGGSGSQVVEAMQALIGAGVDGLWGRETSTRLQEYLIGKGYTCGDSGADGYFGPDSVMALQRCLNDGAFA